MVGRTIGRYHVVAKLGEGGMGSVWRARDPQTGSYVALKFLPRELVHSDAPRRRFLREARAISALDHVGIAALLEAGEANGEMFIACACIDGETVSQIASRGALPVAEAIRIAIESADALEHAHSRGVIHRDITGHNIMVAADGRVAVIDFGLASLSGASRITSSGDAIGTVAYLAPERIAGRPAGVRCDVYGLGVVLYEMLIGTLPFTGDQRAVLIYAAMQTRPDAPSARRPGLPAALDQIVLEAIERDPELRFASAAELANALREHRDSTNRAPPPICPAVGEELVVPAERDRRLLVIPFRNLVPDEPHAVTERVFARGLGETLSASLARVRGLRVIPPSSVSRETEDLDARVAAKIMGAELVLVGVVQRIQDQLRISYSVTAADDGVMVAGDTIDGSMSELFDVEDRLIEGLLKALGMQPFARTPGRRIYSASHEIYVKALGHLQRSDSLASVDSAIELFEQLLESEGETAIVQAQIARAYLEKFTLTQHPEWVVRAESACHEALALAPHSSEVLVTLGRVLIRTGHSDEAAKYLRHALELRADDPEAFQHLSIALQRLGEFSRSEEASRRAISLRPEYWGGYNRLGTLLFEQGKYDEALAPWRRMLELTPDNAQGHSNLAAALFQSGQLAEAADAYRKSIDIQPTVNACSGLGAVLFFTGQLQEASRWFLRGVEINPRDPLIWGNLADAQRWIPGCQEASRQSFERAVDLVRGHLEINPMNAQAWSALAKWLAKLCRHSEAQSAVEQALRLAPDEVDCNVRSATVYELAGNRERAVYFYQRARELATSHVELERDPELRLLREEVGES